MSGREVILSLPQASGDADVFLSAPWTVRWSKVVRGGASHLQAELRSFLRLKPGMAVPQVQGGTGAIWFSELDQLEAALADESWRVVVFEPSGSAALDALNQRRRGLAAKHPLKRGHALTAADVVAVPGGLGLAEEMLAELLGRAICYDLVAGEPITFGMLAGEADVR